MTEPVLYELRDGIAFISLNRPELANAQDKAMTYALDDAFTTFSQDDSARVAILRGEGKHFSAGHDTSGKGDFTTPHAPRSMWWDPAGAEYAERIMAWEEEGWLGMCRRWRELPKPTIAAVHGACVGSALALAWSCDLIVATESAVFADPVVTMGCPGIEFFCHPWVLGPRRAKEFLFTGERMSAWRAYEIGMVNRVVPTDELLTEAEALARRIAERPRFALALTKKAVNVAEDEMGMRDGIDHAFALHQLSHAHNMNVCGSAVLVHDAATMKRASS